MRVSYRDLVGMPFKAHGRGDGGYDCYGLAIEVLRRNGIALSDMPGPDMGLHEFTGLENVRAADGPAPMRIVEISVHGHPLHCGVCLGEGMVIHSLIGAGVVIEPLYRYRNRIRGYYEVS